MVERHLVGRHPGRLHAAGRQPGQHPWVLGRLVQEGVLALHIEQDHRHAGQLCLLHQAGDRGGLAAAGGAQHGGMAGQHRFLFGRHPDHDLLVSHHAAKPDRASRVEHLRRLRVVEREDQAVGERSQPWWPERAVRKPLAQQLHLHPAVVGWQVDAAAGEHGHQQGTVALDAIRLGERAGHHDPQIGASVLAALDPQQGLGGGALHLILRQQHGDRAVLAAGQVEHSGPDRQLPARLGMDLAAGRLDIRVELAAHIRAGGEHALPRSRLYRQVFREGRPAHVRGSGHIRRAWPLHRGIVCQEGDGQQAGLVAVVALRGVVFGLCGHRTSSMSIRPILPRPSRRCRSDGGYGSSVWATTAVEWQGRGDCGRGHCGVGTLRHRVYREDVVC